MSTPAVQVEHLARRYGRRWALADVTFELASGSVMMVGGRNGAGKSTLFRILATAIRPDRGSVAIGGFDVLRDRHDVRRSTALLSHHSYLYDSLTARENLEVFADHSGKRRAETVALLDRVGLASRANDMVSTFSAGMRKRLSFARVLLQKPRVALLDEPYGALDPSGFDLIDDVVRELRADGATVLLASHQWERASLLSDVALILEEGRVLWQGAAREVMGHAC